MRVVTGPTSATVMQTTLTAGGSRLAAALAATAGWVVADCGRWYPDPPSQRVMQASAVVAVVTRPTLDGVEHARHLVDAVHAGAHRVGLVLVGERPYGPAEIAAAIGRAGDRGAGVGSGGTGRAVAGGVATSWGKSPLARSAAAVADGLDSSALVTP